MGTGDGTVSEAQGCEKMTTMVYGLALVLIALNNRIESLLPFVPELLRVLATIRRGQFIRVGA